MEQLINTIAAQNVEYVEGETYYRNRETHVLFGKAMVQGSYLNPELEEMIAVSPTQLVPVNRLRSNVGGQLPPGAADQMEQLRRRTPVRSVPRYDAEPSELKYEHKPIQPQHAVAIRDPEGVLAAQALEQTERHAAQTLTAAEAQSRQIRDKQLAEANAAAIYAEKVKQAALDQQQSVARQTQVQTADLAQSLVPDTTAVSETVPASPVSSGHVDLTTLG